MKFAIPQRLAAAAAPIACEALGLAGIGSVVVGVDMISRPAALMVAGVSALLTALTWARIRDQAGQGN